MTASLAGMVLLLSQIVGRDFADHASIALPALALGVFEAAMVGVGYLTLGRFLGLRRPAR